MPLSCSESWCNIIWFALKYNTFHPVETWCFTQKCHITLYFWRLILVSWNVDFHILCFPLTMSALSCSWVQGLSDDNGAAFREQKNMRRTERRRDIFTVRKRSLRRLCFYTCLSVILFTGVGVPRPNPGGRLKGLARWGLHAYTQGGRLGVRGLSRPMPGGRGAQAHTGGGPAPHPGSLDPGPGGCIPACTEVDPPHSSCSERCFKNR